MNIIPNNKLFIVTSALEASIGIIPFEDRLNQTIEGLKSLREIYPDAIVILAEASPQKINPEKIKLLDDFVDMVADFSGDRDISQFASTNRKSEAENVLMIKMLMLLKQEPALMKMMSTVNRIFKLSARTNLLEGFDINDHDHFGKYVFKKRIPTWLQGEAKEVFTNLLITRFFSFCPSLMDDYFVTCRRNIGVISDTGIDTEHAHFFNIDPDKLVELDTIHCQGIMAGTGATEVY